jgi:hypothetical protein
VTPPVTDLAVTVVGGPELDEEDLDGLARGLAKELDEAEAGQVALKSTGRVPDGAKAGDFVAIGQLVIGAIGALPPVVAAIRGWLRRSPAKRITLVVDGDSLTIESPSSEAENRLIDEWLARHGQGSGA